MTKKLRRLVEIGKPTNDKIGDVNIHVFDTCFTRQPSSEAE